MYNSLPKLGKEAVALPHFPTKHQAFLFRAYEYIPAKKIAKILGTTVETVHRAAADMGLPVGEANEDWLKKGYVTVIRRMWHILPYEQLLELLELDEAALATLMRDEDFLDHKLGPKPICEPVRWRELTESETEATAALRAVMQTLSFQGKEPFDFEYDVPELCFSGEENFSTRMIYAFSGLYQRAFDVDSRLFLPDAQLEAYRKLGINGIWTQGVLSSLTAFPFDPAVSEGYEARLERMRELTERLDKYGIKLYLYLNEPRYMPLAFFEKHPELRGHVRGGDACLCTSTEEVKAYLRDAVEEICRRVPLIGGFFTISRSENMTNCYSHSGSSDAPCNCPRCRERSVGEVVAETIGCFLEGARRVSRDVRVFAWSWRWDEYYEDIIRRLPKEVVLLSQSELGVPFDIGGVQGSVMDYSMSILGPGDRAREEWRVARECGLECAAKVQVNTTWECSTVPAIPVAPSVEEHMRRLRNEGVSHLLLSWTLGGYPSGNLVATAKHFYEKCEFDAAEDGTAEAQACFAEAFREFPFHIRVLYYGPQNAGPSTLLFPEPTGYTATMTGFAYDDLERWCGIYPVDVFEAQLEKLCRGWEKGLALLPKGEESELAVMARATDCLFRSSLDQVRFIRARDRGDVAAAIAAARREIQTAREMLELMNQNASVGYEAANHYYFSKGQIAEKVVNASYIVDLLEKSRN